MPWTVGDVERFRHGLSEADKKTRVIGKSVSQKIDVGMDDRTIEDLWERMAKDGSLDVPIKIS